MAQHEIAMACKKGVRGGAWRLMACKVVGGFVAWHRDAAQGGWRVCCLASGCRAGWLAGVLCGIGMPCRVVGECVVWHWDGVQEGWWVCCMASRWQTRGLASDCGGISMPVEKSRAIRRCRGFAGCRGCLRCRCRFRVLHRFWGSRRGRVVWRGRHR